MDIQFWIYLVLAIIYIVSRAMKKAENQAPEAQDKTPSRQADRARTASTERPKALSFEDLLREITEAKQPQKALSQQPARTEYAKSEVIDYDDQLQEEARDLEVVDYDRRKSDYERRKEERRNVDYEDAKRMAFNRPSLEETMRLKDSSVQFEKFKEFQVDEKPDLLDQYTKEFRDHEGLKKAVVLSEILARKFEY